MPVVRRRRGRQPPQTSAVVAHREDRLREVLHFEASKVDRAAVGRSRRRIVPNLRPVSRPRAWLGQPALPRAVTAHHPDRVVPHERDPRAVAGNCGVRCIPDELAQTRPVGCNQIQARPGAAARPREHDLAGRESLDVRPAVVGRRFRGCRTGHQQHGGEQAPPGEARPPQPSPTFLPRRDEGPPHAGESNGLQAAPQRCHGRTGD
jgi:hypothetical protein